MNNKIFLFLFCLEIIGLVCSPFVEAGQEVQGEEKPPPYTSSTSLSLLLTAGNTETMTFAFDTEQSLRLEKNQFQIKGSVISSRNEGNKDSELYYGHLKYKRDFLEKAYFLGLGRFERNELAGYLHRLSLTGGIGYTWIKKESVDFSTEASVGWNGEKNMIVSPFPDLEGNQAILGNETFSFLSMLVSNAVKLSLSSTSFLDIQEILFFNLKDSKDYRISSLVSLSADISKFLALKFSYQIHYNHKPIPGFKSADHYIFSSLVLNL